MQHSVRSAARRSRRRAFRRFARRSGAVATIVLGGLTTAVGLEVAGADGGGPGSVHSYGEADHFGAATGRNVTGMARTRSGQGYWLVTDSGAVFAFGDAPFHGSLPADSPATIVDIASAPDGNGYWLVSDDGGVFNFGSATFRGSTGDEDLNSPIVGMAATPTGAGYWIVGRDGGVFAFGDAAFHGSPTQTATAVVGMASTPTGAGYWLVAKDGGIFAFGDASFLGSAGGTLLSEPIVGMASTPSGNGYWLASRDGGIFTYGDAPFHGSLGTVSASPIVDIEATTGGAGNWTTSGGRYLGEFTLTCYALRGTTASGVPVRRTGIAVDPRVIPLGDEVYIAGEGTRMAIDTGGLIKGRRIDVWRRSSDECRNFGRQTRSVFAVS